MSIPATVPAENPAITINSAALDTTAGKWNTAQVMGGGGTLLSKRIAWELIELNALSQSVLFRPGNASNITYNRLQAQGPARLNLTLVSCPIFTAFYVKDLTSCREQPSCVAFFVHGSCNFDHTSPVTFILSSPINDSISRTTVNSTSRYIATDQTLYFETGLDRDTQYGLTIVTGNASSSWFDFAVRMMRIVVCVCLSPDVLEFKGRQYDRCQGRRNDSNKLGP